MLTGNYWLKHSIYSSIYLLTYSTINVNNTYLATHNYVFLFIYQILTHTKLPVISETHSCMYFLISVICISLSRSNYILSIKSKTLFQEGKYN